MFPLPETDKFSSVYAGRKAAILENLLEDPTLPWFLRLCSQGLWQLFPKVGMTTQNNILEVLGKRFVCPVLQSGEKTKLRHKKKCQVWICETFLCRISASGATDGRHIVGKTYLTYNSFPPCQEIDISCHKISQNGHFVSKYPSSVTGISCFGPMWPQNPSWPRSQLTSDSGPGLEFSWASTLLKSKAVDQTRTTRYIMTH